MITKENQGYDNEGSEGTEDPAHAPATPHSFPSNMQICEASAQTTRSSSSIATNSTKIGFLPDEVHDKAMVTWHSRKMRQMSVFLVFFVVIALVMTGLFVWRSVFFDQFQADANGKCDGKSCATEATRTPNAPPCRQKVKPRPFKNLPKKIVDQLQFMKDTLNNKTKSSIANVVYMDKEIWSNFHGKIDPDSSSSKLIDEHTLFPVASVTKVITALMVFRLYKDRKVNSLEDKFVKYVPGFGIKRRSSSHKITIREILSQMSGLPREAPCYPESETSMCPFNTSYMLQRINKLFLLTKPGVTASYSNLGFALLGNGFASHLNTTYQEWLKTNLFEPLGMDDTTFEIPKNLSNVAIGNDGSRKEPEDWGWLDPAIGLLTTSADLAKLEIHLFKSLEEDDYLSPVYANEFFSPAYVFPDDKSVVGNPWEMILEDGYLLRFKNGYAYGYSSDMITVPELRLAFNVLQTKEALINGYSLFRNLVRLFHSVLSENKTKISLPPNPNAFIGIYKSRKEIDGSPGISKMEVVLNNEALELRVDGNRPVFQLNFLKNTTFEIWDRINRSGCLSTFIRGFDLERVYFEPPTKDANLSPAFKILAVHPRGWTYFTRVTDTSA